MTTVECVISARILSLREGNSSSHVCLLACLFMGGESKMTDLNIFVCLSLVIGEERLPLVLGGVFTTPTPLHHSHPFTLSPKEYGTR